MSGIAGIVHVDGRPVAGSDLHRMTESMAHRGPDGQTVWSAGSVGFGHCMLHTTPESLTEKLPLANVYGRYTITADARIDNRDRLLDLLELPRRVPEYADSELIVHAYARWGEDCVDHLLGDFAFAIWNETERTLFCARDHFGLKPFYFVEAGRLFAFASEIKALHQLEGVPAELNESWVIDQLLGTTNAQDTVYSHVLRLPPAHLLVLRDGSIRVRRYWTLAPAEHDGSLTDDEYVAGFRELFDQAVRCRTRSAFQIGSELSGGLDSSYVTCVARNLWTEAGRGDLPTFSHVFALIPEADESGYVAAVLEQGGFEPHLIAGDEVGPLSPLDEMYGRVLDDFLVSGTHYLVWESHRAASQAGVRVLLNGLDGDTTVEHGDLYLRELARDGRWQEFHREVNLSAARHASDRQRHDFQEVLSSRSAMLRAYAYPQIEEDARSGRWIAFGSGIHGVGTHFGIPRRRLLRYYWTRLRERRRTVPGGAGADVDRERSALPSSIAPAAATRYDAAGRISRLHARERNLFRSVRDKHYTRLTRPRLSGGLEALNHVAAYFGIESRSPFMDVRLIRYCLSLPSNQSFRNGWSRYILRRSMKGTVPDVIVRRVGKALMSGAFRHSLLNVDGPRLKACLTSNHSVSRLLDITYVREQSERSRELGDGDLNELSRIATLLRWMDIRFGEGVLPGNDLPAWSHGLDLASMNTALAGRSETTIINN